jgi:hypothetical protein
MVTRLKVVPKSWIRYEYPKPPTSGISIQIVIQSSRDWWDWWTELGPRQRDQWIMDQIHKHDPHKS